ncbi:MAG: aspartate/glutamate racemase family protein [Candidatus Saccharimonadales bacterium]
MKIGIFDSGIGGEAVARDLKVHFPEATIVSVSDRANLPYGSKTPEHIIALTDAALQPLFVARCDVIVIACNTATTNALPALRQRYPSQQFIGIEPMVKTAASLTKTHTIAVCATPATLASDRYHSLKAEYAHALTVCEPDCSSWASMIENNTVNEAIIHSTIESVIAEGADVIVLGCTHYHWIKSLIESIADNHACVIEPTDSIARRITQLVG